MARLSGVDVNLIVALGALLDERNLTRAGKRINMSQPAMSGVLARLRKHYDDVLLVRVGRGYELSALAADLHPRVTEAIAQIGRTLEATESFDAATSTRVFSVSISDYALTVVNEPLQRLLGEHAPGVTVEFDPLPATAAEAASALLRRDLLVAGGRLDVGGNEQALFRDRFVCIAAADNPIGVGGRVSLADLVAAPFAVGSFGPQTSTPADRALLEAGVRPRIAVGATGLLPLPFLVSGTDLIAFAPERLALRCLAALDLRVLTTPIEPEPFVETAHWNPANSDEGGLLWLLGLLGRVADVVGRSVPAG